LPVVILKDQKTPAMYDTIIIGAGMSGLAAGIRLAHFGQRVCILERHSAIGGLNSFFRQRGRILDVGLHALTNYAPKGARNGPLARLLRQLRFTWDEWALSPQLGSIIAFQDLSLRFTNEFSMFESEVRKHFPSQVDNLRRLVAQLHDYDSFGQSGAKRSAREVVGGIIDDPLLIEMIFCPILFYGSARPHDLDFDQFSIMFRAIFLEGLARPLAGVQKILKTLVHRFRDMGGELRLRAAVNRIVVKGNAVEKVILENGAELEAANVLSSAGWTETMRMCDGGHPVEDPSEKRMSIVESISILDAHPHTLGYDKTLVFFNDSSKFHYETPDDLIDTRSGIICSPNNFAYPEPLSEGVVRISMLANHGRWAALDSDAYHLAKQQCYERMTASAVRFVPDFRGLVIDMDMFTPLTIHRFTGHPDGSLYGAAEKRQDGTTHLNNLYICGNDQGFVGIVGTIISGISIANKYLLK
jgi:phytoene dehydrogenase-like protein